MVERDGDVICYERAQAPAHHQGERHEGKHGPYRRTVLTKAGSVNHGAGEYVDGDCHVNGMEGFWARLKLSIRGTHVHVSGRHLEKTQGV